MRSNFCKNSTKLQYYIMKIFNCFADLGFRYKQVSINAELKSFTFDSATDNER